MARVRVIGAGSARIASCQVLAARVGGNWRYDNGTAARAA